MEKDVAGDGSKLCWSYSPFSISQKAVYFCKAHTQKNKKGRQAAQLRTLPAGHFSREI